MIGGRKVHGRDLLDVSYQTFNLIYSVSPLLKIACFTEKLRPELETQENDQFSRGVSAEAASCGLLHKSCHRSEGLGSISGIPPRLDLFWSGPPTYSGSGFSGILG
jgi:hypothetical protein